MIFAFFFYWPDLHQNRLFSIGNNFPELIANLRNLFLEIKTFIFFNLRYVEVDFRVYEAIF